MTCSSHVERYLNPVTCGWPWLVMAATFTVLLGILTWYLHRTTPGHDKPYAMALVTAIAGAVFYPGPLIIAVLFCGGWLGWRLLLKYNSGVTWLITKYANRDQSRVPLAEQNTLTILQAHSAPEVDPFLRDAEREVELLLDPATPLDHLMRDGAPAATRSNHRKAR